MALRASRRQSAPSLPMAPTTLVAALVAALVLGSLPAVAGAQSPAATGTWFDRLTPGACFALAFDDQGQVDYATQPVIIPCEQPHDSEVVALPSLGDGDLPADVDRRSQAACDEAYAAFLGRPIAEVQLYPFTVWPDAADWQAGVRVAACIVFGELIGTATSGDLRAPGEQLAVYRQPEETSDLWLLDGGTGEPVLRLTDDATTELLGAPAWLPDGSALLFAAELSETDVDVYRVSTDGSLDARPLITGPGRQDGPSVAPDGSALAYISDVPSGEYDIMVRPPDADPAVVGTPITDHPGRDATPRHSPDGTRILFRRVTDGLSEIWAMGADGSDPVRLIDNGADSYDPRWSPDGEHILFTTAAAGSMDIWIANADGSEARQLTDHPGAEEYPTFSRDGSLIAFQSDRYGGPTLWIMNADGSDVSVLAGIGPVGYPSFSPVAPAG